MLNITAADYNIHAPECVNIGWEYRITPPPTHPKETETQNGSLALHNSIKHL